MPIKSRHGGSVPTRRIGANSGVPAARLAPHSPAYAAHALPALSHARRAHSRTPSLVRRFSRAVSLAPSHLHPPSLVPPFLPHLRPHRAHGATPYDRPDAPLARLSPTPSVSRPAAHPSQGSSVPPADYPAARLVRPHSPHTHPPRPPLRPRPPHTPRRARPFTPRAVLPAIDAHPAPSSPVPAPRRTCARLHPPSLAPPPAQHPLS